MSGRIIALIPARGGSERIPGKNIRTFFGHPLLAYTIAAARESGIFCGIFVSTESDEIGRLALKLGGGDVCWIKRPEEFSQSRSPDIEWVTHALEQDTECASPFDSFAILRPTSPFRSAEMIREAYQQWTERGHDFDSLRAMEPVSEHPGKMWMLDESGYARPFATFGLSNPPAHSRATQSLPWVYKQNASLEIAHVSTVLKERSISGNRIMAFLTQGYQGFDVNTPLDWLVAEVLIDMGLVALPEVL